MNRINSYRPDIDGLRAVAVLGVLLYHIDHGVLAGGFVGVDVFFVISGFLITSLMIRDLEAGKFSLARFYERRVRRILPALFCMIAACCVMAWFVLLPDDLENFAKSVKYAAISLPNLYFLEEIQDYFSPGVSLLPMLHTWSLGVEEQFYAVFPVVLIVLFRFARKPSIRFAAIAVVFAVSLAAACLAVPRHSEAAFFLLPYRAWELTLGSLLAMARPRLADTRWNHAGGVIGLTMILASMAFYTEATPFPGAAALAPCIGAGLLILTGTDSHSITARLLSWKPLVFVGLISYSVYLWHWPLLVFTRYGQTPNSASMAMVFGGSLVAGALSWRFIEQPFRKPGFGTRRMAFGAWAVSCVLLIGFWHAARRTHGFANRYSAEVLRVLEFKNWATAYRGNATKNYRPEDAPIHGAPGVPPDIAIWGDSHARALLPVLDVLARKRGHAIKHFGMNGVPPVVGATPMNVREPAKVSEYNARTLEMLAGDPSIKTVILASQWSLSHSNHPGGGVGLARSFHERSFGDWPEQESYYAGKIEETVRRLLAADKKVVIIDPIPAAPFNVPDEFARILHAGRQPEATVNAPDHSHQHRLMMEVFARLESSGKLLRIKPQDKLITDGRLLLWHDRQPLYADQHHLSNAGVFYLGDILAAAFTN